MTHWKPTLAAALALLLVSGTPWSKEAKDPDQEDAPPVHEIKPAGAASLDGAGLKSDDPGEKKPRAGSKKGSKGRAGKRKPGGAKPGATPASETPAATPPYDPGEGRIPDGAYCAVNPPRLSKISLVIHNRPRPGKLVLDSTPKVCDREFCDKIGFTGRNCCPLGPEGTNARVSCELRVLGIDPEDGIPGPHWSFAGNGSIQKHPENPFLAFVFYESGGGTATVCNNIKPVVCESLKVP